MSHRALSGENSLLRIFIDESDKIMHKRTYEVLIESAREEGLAGCTVLSGLAGYGAGKQLHTPIDAEGAGRFAMIVETIDDPVRVAKFWEKIEPVLAGAASLVTEERIFVHHYGPGNGKQTGESIQMQNMAGENVLLRVYLGESDKAGHEALYLDVVKRARKLGLAGCTAIRGVAGFGADSVIHENHAFRLSQDLPIVLEVVDTVEKVQTLLKEIRPLLKGALITESKVRVHQYQAAAT